MQLKCVNEEGWLYKVDRKVSCNTRKEKNDTLLLPFMWSCFYVLTRDCSRRHSKIFFHCFSEKLRLDVSSESSARQRVHMKKQALFSSKDKRKNNKMSSVAIFVWRFKG